LNVAGAADWVDSGSVVICGSAYPVEASCFRETGGEIADFLAFVRGEGGDVDQADDVVGVGDHRTAVGWPTARTGPGICSIKLVM
jgi:hypothetical protein